MTAEPVELTKGDPGSDANAILPSGQYVAPRVNLLPPEVAERQALRRLQAGLLAGVVACAAIVGGLYYNAHQGRSDAQSKLDQAVAEGQQLTARKNALLPVQMKRSQVQAAKAALKNATAAEVLWSKQLDDLRQHLSAGVRLSTLTVAPAPVTATAAGTKAGTTTPAPTTPAATGGAAGAAGAALPTTGTIATVTMSGVAVDPDAVANWLETMNKLTGWSGAYAQSVTQSQGEGYTFNATASISAAALSHRSDDGS